MMDRAKFYAAVRASLFGGRLSEDQVKGMDPLIDECIRAKASVQDAAYIHGGVYHETGRKMTPVREGFAKTDAGARAAVAKLAARRGANSAVARYARPVGPHGHVYYGRGRIQNTWLENMERLQKRFGKPFVANPDLLLDSAVDAEVTVVGHIEGIWTGKKLSDYIKPGKADYYGARRIVNGTDKAAEIAGYAKKFEAAFRAAGYGVDSKVAFEPAIEPAKVPPAAAPVEKPIEKPAKKPATKPAQPAKSASAWRAIFEVIFAMFRGKA